MRIRQVCDALSCVRISAAMKLVPSGIFPILGWLRYHFGTDGLLVSTKNCWVQVGLAWNVHPQILSLEIIPRDSVDEDTS